MALGDRVRRLENAAQSTNVLVRTGCHYCSRLDQEIPSDHKGPPILIVTDYRPCPHGAKTQIFEEPSGLR